MKQFNALVNNEPRLFNVSEDRESDFFSVYPDATLVSPPSDDDIIPYNERLKLNYPERQYLSRNNLKPTYKNVRNAKAELQKLANKSFDERIEDLKNDIVGDKKLNVQKFNNLSYQLFGPDGIGGAPGILMAERAEQIYFAYATALDKIFNDKETADRLKQSQKDLQKIQKISAQKPIPSVTDDDLSGLFGTFLGIAGDATQVGTSVVPTVLAATGAAAVAPVVGVSAGTAATVASVASIFSQIAPSFISDYNIEKAKALYPNAKTDEEAFRNLVNNDQTELLTPLAGAGIATLPEYTGQALGPMRYLVGNKIGKQILGKLGKRMYASGAKGYLLGGVSEGATEVVQLFPEAVNTQLARGKSMEDSMIEAFDFTYDNSTKTFISAFTGTLAFGGLAKGGASITQAAWKRAKNMRVAIDQEKMEAVIDEIAVLNQKRIEANSQELKEGIDEQIKDKVNELENLVVKTASVYNFAEDKDFDQIDNLEDLKKKYISKVKNIQNQRDELDPVEYRNALELYKQKFLEAQNKIKGVVNNISDKSNKQAQEVNKIYENEITNETNTEKQQAGIGKIVELYRGMAKRIALKRKNAPNFDLDLLTDEILTGKRGILDLINNYQKYVTKQQKENKPVAPLSGYINTNISRRAIEASNRVLGDEFTEDVTTQKKVAQPETTEELIENQVNEIKKQLADKLNLKEEFKKSISDSAKKILGTRLPEIGSKDFKSKIVKSLRDDLFKLFKKDVFQVDRTYKDFLSNNFEKIFASIPQATLNKRFSQLFTEKQLTEEGKALREKTPEGKFVYKKPPITKQQWVDYFTKQPEGVPANSWGKTKSSRKGSLAQVLADETGLDQIVQNIADPEIATKFKDIQELSGKKLEPGFAKRVIQAIDRSIAELDKFQQENLLSDFGVIQITKSLLKFTKLLIEKGVSISDAIKQTLDKLDDAEIGKYLSVYEANKLKDTYKDNIDLLEKLIDSKKYKESEQYIEELIEKYRNKTKLAKRTAFENSMANIMSNKFSTLTNDQEKVNFIEEYHRLFFDSLKDLDDRPRVKGKKTRIAYYRSSKINNEAYKNYSNLLQKMFGKDLTNFNATKTSISFKYKNKTYNIKQNILDKKIGGKSIVKLQFDKPETIIKRYNENKEQLIQESSHLAEGNRKVMFEYLDAFKEAIEKDPNNEQLKEDVYFVISSLGDQMRALGKRMFEIGTDPRIDELLKNNKKEVTAEHNAPYMWTVKNVLMPYVLGSFKNKSAANSVLKNQKIYLIPSSLDTEYLSGKNNNLKEGMPDGFKITDNPLKRYEKAGLIKEMTKDQLVQMRIFPSLKKLFKTKKSLAKNATPIEINENDSVNKIFNKFLENVTGIDWAKQIQRNDAKIYGKLKREGLLKKIFGIPYDAEDFAGLLYSTLGKGKLGDQQLKFYEDVLFKPFAEGIRKYEVSRQTALAKWTELKSKIKDAVPGGLKEINETGFSNEMSVRIYIWDSQGMVNQDINAETGNIINDLEIDSEKYLDHLKIVRDNPKLKAWADQLKTLFDDGYPAPTKAWIGGGIQTDLLGNINDSKRKDFLSEWKENVDQIFSKENKNKLESLYGEEYIDSLENALEAMETGRNRIFGKRLPFEKGLTTWITGSVGTIMFLNARSAILQMISSINFLNLSDNNPIAAAKAAANIKQYSKDIAFLYNSEFLKGRRGGLRTDINADDIARAAEESSNPLVALTSAVLKKGFILTQVADSMAITIGGAAFYRNRINSLMKEGMSKEDAENEAFLKFQELTEESQQSSRPDKLSRQQRSTLGRFILNFANTPMQYARLIKKATLDLVNGRGDRATNVSKILYYGAIQNIIFTSLQQGLFALAFDDEEDDYKKIQSNQEKYANILEGTVNTLLRGTGMYGALGAAGLSILRRIKKDKELGRGYDDTDLELIGLSPSLSSKLRKISTIERYYSWKQYREKMNDLSMDNTHLRAAAAGLEFVNIPAERLLRKYDNIKAAMDNEHQLMKRVALGLGWSKWSLNIKDTETISGGKSKSKSKTKTKTKTKRK